MCNCKQRRDMIRNTMLDYKNNLREFLKLKKTTAMKESKNVTTRDDNPVSSGRDKKEGSNDNEASGNY